MMKILQLEQNYDLRIISPEYVSMLYVSYSSHQILHLLRDNYDVYEWNNMINLHYHFFPVVFESMRDKQHNVTPFKKNKVTDILSTNSFQISKSLSQYKIPAHECIM